MPHSHVDLIASQLSEMLYQSHSVKHTIDINFMSTTQIIFFISPLHIQCSTQRRIGRTSREEKLKDRFANLDSLEYIKAVVNVSMFRYESTSGEVSKISYFFGVFFTFLTPKKNQRIWRKEGITKIQTIPNPSGYCRPRHQWQADTWYNTWRKEKTKKNKQLPLKGQNSEHRIVERRLLALTLVATSFPTAAVEQCPLCCTLPHTNDWRWQATTQLCEKTVGWQVNSWKESGC